MEPCTFQAKPKRKKNPRRENFLYFRKQKPRKNVIYLLKRKLFLYFGKRKSQQNSLYFTKKNRTYVSYVSGKDI